jgi:nucleoside-diphosphate-sugar epimerase
LTTWADPHETDPPSIGGAVRRVATLLQSRDVRIRMAADAVLLVVALFAGASLRFVWFAAFEPRRSDPAEFAFGTLVRQLLGTFWVFCGLSLLALALVGVYTTKRRRRRRIKGIAIVQALTAAFVTGGFLISFVSGSLLVSRGALLAGFAIAVALLSGARFWISIWPFDVTEPEPQPSGPPLVLVVGGAGYVGSGLLPQLLDAGYRVRLLDLMLFGPEVLADVWDHPSLEIVRGDFRRIDAVVAAMTDVTAVVHLGAIVGDPACALDEALTIETNLTATRVIAEIAKGRGVERFVFASTCSVYGASDGLLTEQSALNPVSIYAQSKAASERVLLRMADETFAPVILRFGTIYGFSGRTRFDLVVNLLTAKAVVDGEITVFGGDQWRPFVHVLDASRAVFAALEAPLHSVRGHIFNVGSDEQNHTIDEIGKLVRAEVPDATLLSVGNDGDRRNYRVSFEKIRTALGFQPAWTVEAGIAQVAGALRSGSVGDYHAARYSNVKFLSDEGLEILNQPDLSGWQAQLLEEVPIG